MVEGHYLSSIVASHQGVRRAAMSDVKIAHPTATLSERSLYNVQCTRMTCRSNGSQHLFQACETNVCKCRAAAGALRARAHHPKMVGRYSGANINVAIGPLQQESVRMGAIGVWIMAYSFVAQRVECQRLPDRGSAMLSAIERVSNPEFAHNDSLSFGPTDDSIPRRAGSGIRMESTRDRIYLIAFVGLLIDFFL